MTRIYMHRARLIALEREIAEIVRDLRWASATLSIRGDTLACLGSHRPPYVQKLDEILHTSERVARALEEQIIVVKKALHGTDDGHVFRPNVPGVNLHPVAIPTWTGAQLALDLQYPGNGASKQKLACWMAANAVHRGIPPELPIMAALVESGMYNNPGGGRDSAGFFQMRTSIWSSSYPGYQRHPEKQIDWFLDQAAAAARHNPSLKKSLGTWCADIERPAAQYRGRYATRYDEAKKLVARCAADAASGGGASPAHHHPHPIKPPVVGATPGSAVINVALAEAAKGVDEYGHHTEDVRKFLHTLGFSSLSTAWCSCFVAWDVKRALGSFPPGVNGMADSWLNVARPPTEWPQPHPKYRIHTVKPPGQPGDIVYYGGTGGHVGLLASPVKNGAFEVVDGNTSGHGHGSGVLMHKTRHVASDGSVDGYFKSMTIIRIEKIA